MNETIERIKRTASLQLPPQKVKYNGADVEGDEKRTRDFLEPFGYGWFATHERNKYERWDIEGHQVDLSEEESPGEFARVEVKSRPKPNTYPTWIIDSYKVDYLLENFPDDMNYFVNVCEGRYELYDMRLIANSPKVKSMAKMWNGGSELKTFYKFDKTMYIIELSSGELGPGAEYNEKFGK